MNRKDKRGLILVVIGLAVMILGFYVPERFIDTCLIIGAMVGGWGLGDLT